MFGVHRPLYLPPLHSFSSSPFLPSLPLTSPPHVGLCLWLKVKCAQYWPSPSLGSITYGDIDVKLDNVVELRDYAVRNFTVTHVSPDRPYLASIFLSPSHLYFAILVSISPLFHNPLISPHSAVPMLYLASIYPISVPFSKVLVST